MSIGHNTLDNLSFILEKEDCSSLPQNEFYNNILINLSNEVYSSFSGIYFLDDIQISKKALIDAININPKKNVFANDKNVELLHFLNLKSEKTFSVEYSQISAFLDDETDYLNYNFLFSKLCIKGSLFGFAFFAKKDVFTFDEISIIKLYINTYSYLIKDYELNKVYKTQLSLLQEAIFEKENAYKIIEKQNKKLIQADSVKTSFLANVSHELRTPLNAIIGFSEVLLEQIFGSLNEKQTEYIKDINIASVHLMGLINSILDFSKIESGSMKLNMTAFDPNLSISEVVRLLSPLLNAKELKIIYNSDFKGTLKADFQKFQQILYNIIGNAIKFSPRGSQIIITIKQNGDYFEFRVQDFGIGIEKKYHSFIFKKFTQIDNVYTKTGASTGLGLAITKEYVKLHKGKIFVISQSGLGSTFVVQLCNKISKYKRVKG